MPPRLTALCATLVLAGFPAQLLAEPFRIMDKEGFEAPMTAMTIDLPPGWTAEGRIAWAKPCSGNEMYEVILNAVSPDGQSGLRFMPGHAIVWNEVRVAGIDPAMAQMVVAQNEAALADMRQQYQNSNCHVGKITGGSEQLIRGLILARRPAGARIDRLVPNQPVIDQYKAGIGGMVAQGMLIRYDAVVADLSYSGPQGPMVERLWLSWYQFADDGTPPPPGVPGFGYQSTVVETVAFAYAPASRAGDLDLAAKAMAGAQADPAWTARINEELRKREAERQRIRAEAEAARQAREEADRLRAAAAGGYRLGLPLTAAP